MAVLLQADLPVHHLITMKRSNSFGRKALQNCGNRLHNSHSRKEWVYAEFFIPVMYRLNNLNLPGDKYQNLPRYLIHWLL